MQARGFTLIEIMIAVAIIGILTAIAYPNFTDYLKKAKRSDAKTALMAVQHAQARLRANCRFYAETLLADDKDGVNDSVCGDTAGETEVEVFTTSPEGFYTLEVVAGSASASAYTVVADRGVTDVPSGSDVADGCQYILLKVDASNPNGELSASSDESGVPDNTANCF